MCQRVNTYKCTTICSFGCPVELLSYAQSSGIGVCERKMWSLWQRKVLLASFKFSKHLPFNDCGRILTPPESFLVLAHKHADNCRWSFSLFGGSREPFKRDKARTERPFSAFFRALFTGKECLNSTFHVTQLEIPLSLYSWTFQASSMYTTG